MWKFHTPKVVTWYLWYIYARKCQQQVPYIHIFHMSKEMTMHISYPILPSFSNYHMDKFTNKPEWAFYEFPT